MNMYFFNSRRYLIDSYYVLNSLIILNITEKVRNYVNCNLLCIGRLVFEY